MCFLLVLVTGDGEPRPTFFTGVMVTNAVFSESKLMPRPPEQGNHYIRFALNVVNPETPTQKRELIWRNALASASPAAGL